MGASNNKAMREALDDTVGLLESILEAFEQGTGGVYMSDVAEAIDKARAALAAPPRNCDKFDDLYSAQRYYIEHGCPKGLGKIVDGEIRKTPWKSQFEKWLFAIATEQKGGAK